MKNLVQRIGLATLGAALLFAVWKIGEIHFAGFRTEYGWSVNVFGANEGAFFFLYTLLGSFAIALFSFAGGGALFSLLSRVDPSRINPARIVICLSLGTFLAAVYFRFVVFLETPMTDDENAYLFAARIIAHGKVALSGYPEALRPFLENQFLIMGDRVYTQYYPGFPLVLALPVSLGIEWFVNPLAAALGIVGTYLLGRELTGDRWTGLLAATLLFVSPDYILTAGMLLSHPVAATLGVFGLYLVWRGRQGGSLPAAFLGAFCIGLLLWTRPLSGAVCGIAGAWMLFSSSQPLRRKLSVIAIAALAALFFCGGLLVYHYFTTGDPLVSGYARFSEHAEKSISILSFDQFVSGKWLQLLAFPLLRLDNWLFGWPISLFLLPFVPKGPARFYGFLVVIGIWLAHLSWKATGVNLTGAAHYFEALPMLAILSASALLALLRRNERAVPVFTLNAMVFSTVLALVVFFPWATRNLHRLAKYNIAPYAAVEEQARPPAVIFATYTFNLYDLKQRSPETWTYFRKNNSVELNDDVLWLNDKGPQNVVAMRLFPGRRYYRLVSEATATGLKRFRVEEITEEILAREAKARAEKRAGPRSDDVNTRTGPEPVDGVDSAVDGGSIGGGLE